MNFIYLPKQLLNPIHLSLLLLLSGISTASLAITPMPAVAQDTNQDVKRFCDDRNYDVIRLSNSPLEANSIQALQRNPEHSIKLVVDSDRLSSKNLYDIANEGRPILIDLAKTVFSARDISNLTRRNPYVQVLVNSDRIAPKDLRSLASSGVSFVVEVGRTSIAPQDIRSLQRNLTATAKPLELVVNSDRIAPRDLRSIARGGAKVVFDTGATGISLADIYSVNRQNGQAALFITANRFASNDVNAFIRSGGSVIGSPFCL